MILILCKFTFSASLLILLIFQLILCIPIFSGVQLVFWTAVLEGLLRVPWTARRSNLSILKEISPEYSLEGLMLKLKPQYFGHLMQRTDSLEKILMLEKIEGRGKGDERVWDGWMASPTWWTWVSSGRWCCTGKPGML